MGRFLLQPVICIAMSTLMISGPAAYGAETPTTPLIHAYRLDNGLKLIVKEDHRAPVVLSSIWYRVGGSYEYNGITGISHVLEHMMFQGTPTYGPTVLEKLVAAAGGDQNATTMTDLTGYYQRLPVQALSLSFTLEADRMRHLILSDAAFKKEIQVVMEERRMRVDDNPQQVAQERLCAAAFVNNPYRDPVVGWMTDLENMNVNDVRDWYKRWYYPNNAVVVVVGDVDPAYVYRLAKQYFGVLPSHTLPVLKPRTAVPPLGDMHLTIQVPAKVPYLLMGYRAVSLTDQRHSTEAYAIDVLSSLIGGSDSARLQRALIREQRLATSIEVEYNAFSLYDNLFEIAAVPMPGVSVAQLEQALIQQLTLLKKERITDAELNRIKAQLMAAKVYSRDSAQTEAMMLAVPEMIGLDWEVGEHYLEALQKVTAEDVQKAAIKYLDHSRLTVAVVEPSEKK